MKPKTFQRLDLARLALVDGAILGWDTGLGKTWAMFLWPLLKCGYTTTVAAVCDRPSDDRAQEERRSQSAATTGATTGGTTGVRITPKSAVLLVVPGDLHDKTIRTARDIFRTEVTALDSQETLLGLSTVNPKLGLRELPPGFYITSYTQLGTNGTASFPDPSKLNAQALLEALNGTTAHVAEFFDRRGEHFAREYNALGAKPTDTARELKGRLQQAVRHAGDWIRKDMEKHYWKLEPFHCDVSNPQFHDLPASQRGTVMSIFNLQRFQECSKGLGELRNGIRCIHSPTLSDLSRDTYDCVVIDEGVRIKGAETLIALGVRNLRARCRLVLSATPIKNRLPDVFHLASWVTNANEGANARFPYDGSQEDHDGFAKEFCVSERNVTKEAQSETGRRYRKLTPQVCNVHKVWKLFGPIILRRRKKDIGEGIVARTKHIIRVPMGTEQAKVYEHHLNGRYRDCNGKDAIGAKLQALRSVAAAPHSGLLEHKPQPQGDEPLPGRSSFSYTPKIAAALTLARDAMLRREQIVMFSALNEPLDEMSKRLTEAGVPHLVLDGRKTPKVRGKFSAQFRLGQPGGIPVMLAGIECMAEGHDWPLCNNAANLAYSWAFDKNAQAIDRCHRLNSVKDLNYYPIITDGTIERRMEAMTDEKSDASELVLDGHLLGETPEEVNLADLLRTAALEFKAGMKTVDERELEADWPALREELRRASAVWNSKPVEELPPIVKITIPEPAAIAIHPPLHAWRQRLERRRESLVLTH